MAKTIKDYNYYKKNCKLFVKNYDNEIDLKSLLSD